YVQNIYLALTLYRYDNSLVNKELGERKIYSIDIGLNNAIEFNFSDNIGKSLENAVFLELKRLSYEIFYYRDVSCECDFILADNGQITEALQVSCDISNTETKKREIKGLLTACKNFKLSSGIIISCDNEDEFVQDGIDIKIIPFFKWQYL
ncbi:MAG: ATP-binding protein, partial [Thiotrichaceae bacterium]|nr:ATP-binding protein [Thiotrichaceae bacterium]